MSSLPRLAVMVASSLLALTLLVLAPFAAALEIHHELAEADHDGHQHSDSDLCQWVQHHSTGSHLLDVPVVESSLAYWPDQTPATSLLPSVRPASTGPSRAPPLS
ncbi:MAG: hypothetical protein HY205_03180 [Nitrospirae bacterium]|nr:hypothetical protein [Nitrospirota bacterium]